MLLPALAVANPAAEARARTEEALRWLGGQPSVALKLDGVETFRGRETAVRAVAYLHTSPDGLVRLDLRTWERGLVRFMFVADGKQLWYWNIARNVYGVTKYRNLRELLDVTASLATGNAVLPAALLRDAHALAHGLGRTWQPLVLRRPLRLEPDVGGRNWVVSR